ncbi:hypothetical protein G9A89_011435 [Geosiphon pyriformis]|nr:hypothetical protein G9A89_011435 [Geosiphon pyriformis]
MQDSMKRSISFAASISADRNSQSSIKTFFKKKEETIDQSNKKPKLTHNNDTIPFVDLELPNAQVLYYTDIGLSSKESNSYYRELSLLPYWRRPTFIMFGRPAYAARKTCSFGSDSGKVYRYSGTTASVDAVEYPPTVKIIKEKIEKILRVEFNFVLLNWYKNGEDSIGEHSDDEKGLVPDGVIACVSLGSQRALVFKNKNDRKLTKKWVLEDGSLLVMKGKTQLYWKHSIPKQKRVIEGRISLTFRQLI